MSRPRIMIFCHRRMLVYEALAIARALRDGHGIEVLFVNDRLVTSSEAPRAEETIEFAVRSNPPLSVRTKLRLLSLPVVSAAANARAVQASERRISAALERERPAALVIFDDRRLQPDGVALRLAKVRRTPVILAPYAASSREARRFVRRGDLRYAAPPMQCRMLNRLAARRHPEQVADGMLFYPALETLILGGMGKLPSCPWVLGASGPDVVCALGADHRDQLLNEGVRADRIVVTGQATTDTLAIDAAARARLRDRLRAQYRLPTDRPILVCAVPQQGEHGMTSWDRHRILTAELFRALQESGAGVLLSLHPKSRREDYLALSSTHGLEIADERLSELLAAADLFVASFSTTVRWAIGLGIPAFVIDNLNRVNRGYQMYRSVPGVTIVGDHGTLGTMLRNLVADPTKLAVSQTAAAEGMRSLGKVDGRSAARISNVIAQSIAIEGQSPFAQPSCRHS
jgi:hypothetical protein